jgi:hypothetical protein
MNLSQKKLAAKGGLRSIAAFLAPALIGLVVVGAVIAWKQELFVTRTPIFIFTDSALGITKGIPVKVFGLTVGTVDDIEIVPGTPGNKGQVRIRLNIGSEYLHHITKDSRAKLMREGVVGQALIEILPGDQSVRPVGRNEVIAFERGKTLGRIRRDGCRRASTASPRCSTSCRNRTASSPRCWSPRSARWHVPIRCSSTPTRLLPASRSRPKAPSEASTRSSPTFPPRRRRSCGTSTPPPRGWHGFLKMRPNAFPCCSKAEIPWCEMPTRP